MDDITRFPCFQINLHHVISQKIEEFSLFVQIVQTGSILLQNLIRFVTGYKQYLFQPTRCSPESIYGDSVFSFMLTTIHIPIHGKYDVALIIHLDDIDSMLVISSSYIRRRILPEGKHLCNGGIRIIIIPQLSFFHECHFIVLITDPVLKIVQIRYSQKEPVLYGIYIESVKNTFYIPVIVHKINRTIIHISDTIFLSYVKILSVLNITGDCNVLQLNRRILLIDILNRRNHLRNPHGRKVCPRYRFIIRMNIGMAQILIFSCIIRLNILRYCRSAFFIKRSLMEVHNKFQKPLRIEFVGWN